jgi:hypothetical protein
MPDGRRTGFVRVNDLADPGVHSVVHFGASRHRVPEPLIYVGDRVPCQIENSCASTVIVSPSVTNESDPLPTPWGPDSTAPEWRSFARDQKRKRASLL